MVTQMRKKLYTGFCARQKLYRLPSSRRRVVGMAGTGIIRPVCLDVRSLKPWVLEVNVMQLSARRQFVFVHVYKAAGESIKAVYAAPNRHARAPGLAGFDAYIARRASDDVRLQKGLVTDVLYRSVAAARRGPFRRGCAFSGCAWSGLVESA
jgi:hypothetical protein